MNFTVTLLLLLLLLLYLMLNSLILLCIKPYGTLYNNNDPADNIPISTVVIQDSLYKHNIHHEITSHIPLELPIPKFTATESTDELERKTFTKKTYQQFPIKKYIVPYPILIILIDIHAPSRIVQQKQKQHHLPTNPIQCTNNKIKKHKLI